MNSTKSKKTKGKPDPVDIHVGQRLRTRRSLLGMSQERLASDIGLTFQQIQKYERGTNRVSAGRLYQFSKLLSVPITYFYEQLDGVSKAALSLGTVAGLSDNEQEEFSADDIMSRKETIDLVRTYYAIKDPNARKDILKFIKSMADRIDQE